MGFLEDLSDSWNNFWTGGQHNQKKQKLKINNNSGRQGWGEPGSGQRKNPIRPIGNTGGRVNQPSGRREIRTPLNLSPQRPPMQSNPVNNLRNMMDQRAQGLTGSDPLAGGGNVMDDILGQLQEGYNGPSPTGGGDFGRAEIMKALDAALGGALGGINSARGNANSNFQESDQNVANMHSAFQDDIRTNGKQAFNDISDQLVGGLRGNRDESVGELNQMESRDRAERVAMLKSLGIQEAGGAPESQVYDDAASDITQRTSLGVTAGEQQRSGNLAFNESLATTTGLQGMNRRADLARQLQSILGQLDSSESDIRTQDARARAAAESDINQNRMRAAEMEYGQWQGSQDNLRGLLDQLQEQENVEQDRAFDQDRYAQEQSNWEQEMAMKNQPEAPEPVRQRGFAEVAQNLSNSGIDPNLSSRAIQLLSRGAAEGVFERDSSFSGKIKYLIDNGIPDSVALQIVTDYANL